MHLKRAKCAVFLLLICLCVYCISYCAFLSNTIDIFVDRLSNNPKLVDQYNQFNRDAKIALYFDNGTTYGLKENSNCITKGVPKRLLANSSSSVEKTNVNTTKKEQKDTKQQATYDAHSNLGNRSDYKDIEPVLDTRKGWMPNFKLLDLESSEYYCPSEGVTVIQVDKVSSSVKFTMQIACLEIALGIFFTVLIICICILSCDYSYFRACKSI